MAAAALSTVVVLGGAGVAGATGSAAGNAANQTYPVPPPPDPATDPATVPPVLARTGSDSVALAAIGAGAIAAGGGFGLLARRRRLALNVN